MNRTEHAQLTIEDYLNKYNTRYGIWMAYFDEKMTLPEARLWEEVFFDPESMKAYLFLCIYRDMKALIDLDEDHAPRITKNA
jgi:hypothetical protein